MIDTAEQTTTECLACGSPIIQIAGRGHRKRLYCDDRCRQRAHRAKGQGNVTIDTNGDLQQRIAELEQRNAELKRLIDRYITTRKETTQPWKKTLQERWVQLGKAADWPALTIQIHVPAGEREHRLFGMNASNELIEEGNITLRRQLEERKRNQS
jgi:hypothetical protein